MDFDFEIKTESQVHWILIKIKNESRIHWIRLFLIRLLIKSKSAILDFSFRQLKSKNLKPIQTLVARGADPSLQYFQVVFKRPENTDHD